MEEWFEKNEKKWESIGGSIEGKDRSKGYRREEGEERIQKTGEKMREGRQGRVTCYEWPKIRLDGFS